MANHLSCMEAHFSTSFHDLDVTDFNWVQNPFNASLQQWIYPAAKIEQLIEISRDRLLHTTQSLALLPELWLTDESISLKYQCMPWNWRCPLQACTCVKPESAHVFATSLSTDQLWMSPLRLNVQYQPHHQILRSCVTCLKHMCLTRPGEHIRSLLNQHAVSYLCNIFSYLIDTFLNYGHCRGHINFLALKWGQSGK